MKKINPNRFFISLFLCSILFISPKILLSEETQRFPWQLDTTSYNGPHRQSFQKLQWSIPNLVRQTMIDIAVKLGLSFEEGWKYPLTIGFEDGSPMGVENVLAYVQMLLTERGIEQRLVINLQAYEHDEFNFEKVFMHELVHAMLNDEIGAESAGVLPVWLHEGLAVYGANQGETMMTAYVQRLNGNTEGIINGLDGPHGGLDYLEDYLAIKYIRTEHGSNGLQNFVREVIKRKGDVRGAIEYTCFEKWDDFQRNASFFSNEEIRQIAPARRGDSTKPY